MAKRLLLGVIALLSAASPALSAESAQLITLSQADQLSVSASPWEGWHISVCAPVIFGAGAVPTVGLQASKTFPLGLWSEPGSLWRNLGLGVSAAASMPLDFQGFYLSPSLGLSHGIPLGPLYLDYGLRYGGLFQFGAVTSAYHGPLANLGLSWSAGRSTTYVGLQAGFYTPLGAEGPQEPLWILQPVLGANVNL